MCRRAPSHHTSPDFGISLRALTKDCSATLKSALVFALAWLSYIRVAHNRPVAK